MLEKSFVLFIVILTTINAFAGPSSSVFHFHGSRSHTHPFPKHGVAHKHGSGALGRIKNLQVQVRPANRNDDEMVITSTVNSTSESGPLLKLHTITGEVNCRRGNSDCNQCAINIIQQFQTAAARKIGWSAKPWRFNWQQRYAPEGLRPNDIFNGDPAYALGIPDTHIQGFVRTNSTRYPYAGTHSHKKKGGIFVIKQEKNGKKYLSSLHQSRVKHPSGVHIIGKYLLFGEGNVLVFKNIDSPNQQQDIRFKINNANFGGGLGVVKLNNNHHLVITTGPGGQSRGPRTNRFYSLMFKNGRPSNLKYLSESPSRIPSQWPRGLVFSENLSVITECGTGDIYIIHTSGDVKGISAITGSGYWRLSKLTRQNQKLSLNPVSAFVNRQNMVNCNVKASGTVYVNVNRKLEFYCHGYAKDPDGSAFNVLGRSSRDKDKFYFKVGTVR